MGNEIGGQKNGQRSTGTLNELASLQNAEKEKALLARSN
jgi:hypothetical protein